MGLCLHHDFNLSRREIRSSGEAVEGRLQRSSSSEDDGGFSCSMIALVGVCWVSYLEVLLGGCCFMSL